MGLTDALVALCVLSGALGVWWAHHCYMGGDK